MNNLKFKVYNNHAKDFVSNGSEVAIFDMVSWAKYCYVNGFSDVSHLRFLFFTGLNDKNDNLIFEGDIIRGMFDFGPAGFKEEILPINWHSEKGYQWEYWELPTIEVVGNIFDNPELLK